MSRYKKNTRIKISFRKRRLINYPISASVTLKILCRSMQKYRLLGIIRRLKNISIGSPKNLTPSTLRTSIPKIRPKRSTLGLIKNQCQTTTLSRTGHRSYKSKSCRPLRNSEGTSTTRSNNRSNRAFEGNTSAKSKNKSCKTS